MNHALPRSLALLVSVVGLLGAFLPGCSGGTPTTASGDDSFSTGLESLSGESEAGGEEGTLPKADEGITLSEVLARADRAHSRDETRQFQEIIPPAEPVPNAAAVPPRTGKAVPPAEKILSRTEQIAKLSAELRIALTTDAPRSEVFRNALALCALSLASPQPAGASDVELSENEQAVVTSVRGLMATLASAQGDTEGAARAFLNAADALDPSRSVKISRVELCGVVSGFGRYEPFGSIFPAGRANKVIVYTELDRFSHRAARDGDPGCSLGSDSSDAQWAVEVSQELRMTHDADGSMQWRTPEETIIEVARNRRKDFYLVQSVTLPQTLSVGDYALKVIVRDKLSGSTDERIIPVRIVADPALARDR